MILKTPTEIEEGTRKRLLNNLLDYEDNNPYTNDKNYSIELQMISYNHHHIKLLLEEIAKLTARIYKLETNQ